MPCKNCKEKPVITLINSNISLCKTCFIKYVEKKVAKTISKYKLFNRKDRIAVAVSGGKDSTTCLYILNKLGYNIEGITIDASIGNYTKENLKNIKEVCKENKINLKILSFRKEFGMSLCYLRQTLNKKGYDYSSCMLCGILKRYLLNKYSREMQFDCLVTGHNMDDEAQSFLMNVFRNDFRLATRQGPITGISKSKKFTKRVKPLYNLTEEEIKTYSKIMKFPVNYEICPCSVDSYRREYNKLLNNFEKKHPCTKYNIIKFQEKLKSKIKPKSGANICEICGEPASQKVCKVCKIIKELTKNSSS